MKLMPARLMLLLLLLLGAVATGCQQIPIKYPVQATFKPQLPPPSVPLDFEVLKVNSASDALQSPSRLTILLSVRNPNAFPRSFRSVRVELYDAAGRYAGAQTWTTQRAPFIVNGNDTVPVAVTFVGVIKWLMAKAVFSGVSTPATGDVHTGVRTLGVDPVGGGEQLRAAITIQNNGALSAANVTVLAAGYDADGNLVAWAPGLDQWRTVAPGTITTLETDNLTGDLKRITTVKAFVSAYRG